MATEDKKVTSPVHVWLCDYAAVGADGTITIVRGGIERLGSPALPVNALIWMYAELQPGILPAGDHKVHVSIEKESVRLFEVSGGLKLIQPSQRSRFAMPLSFTVQAFGEVTVVVTIGKVAGERKLLIYAVESGVSKTKAVGGVS